MRRPLSRPMLAGSLALALGGLAACSPAHAADMEVRRRADMSIALIVLSGEIELTDGKKFAAIAAGLGQQRAAVAFDSPGGSLFAGLQIGQIIRLRRYATFVTQDTVCASACAFAWLAGMPRIMQEGARIGFHAAYVKDHGNKVETGVGNALAGAYMTNLGLSMEAIVYVETAHPDEITWLTPRDAQRLGISMKIVPGESHPTRPQPTEPPPAPASVSVKPTLQHPGRTPSLLTPELTEPQPSALPGAGPAEQARLFASAYFAHWSEANADAIAYFGNSYAPAVTYYGKSVDRDTLVQTKRGYAERWPIRLYSVQSPSLRAFCNPSNMICTISGIVDWDCRSPGRDASSKGSANFSLTVSLADGRQQILAESGSVIATGSQ